MRAVGDEPLERLDRTRVTVAAGPLVGPVLARVVGIHAARADLGVDRLEDAVLVADAIAASGPDLSPDGRLPVAVQSTPGRLELRVGPLEPGGARKVLEGATLPEVGPVVERLATSVRIREGTGGGEHLVVRVESTDPSDGQGS